MSASASAAAAHPEIWQWLAEVPDPEIPVVSVVDLGMVRDVAYRGNTLVVTVTPTYSGCPATAIIAQLIRAHLQKKGIPEVRVEQKLSPPWTTDWMTPEARRKLKAFGIAPPQHGAVANARVGARAARLMGGGTPVPCPHCGSTDTELISPFGSTPCKATYRCKVCLEPFDYFKCL